MNKMHKYILGNKVISTTEDRYNRTFKALGYEPYAEKKVVCNTKETTESKQNKKSSNKED